MVENRSSKGLPAGTCGQGNCTHTSLRGDSSSTPTPGTGFVPTIFLITQRMRAKSNKSTLQNVCLKFKAGLLGRFAAESWDYDDRI